MKTLKLSNGIEVRNDCMGKEVALSRHTQNADEMRKVNKKYRRKNAERKNNN